MQHYYCTTPHRPHLLCPPFLTYLHWACSTQNHLPPRAQELGQEASTDQYASSEAGAEQSGTNANAPVATGAYIDEGDSSADQYLDNSASSEASNDADTTQDATQSQDSSSDCFAGCGGSGQAQALYQLTIRGVG